MPEPRQYHTQQTHYLRKTITFADDDVEVTVGFIPSGSLILKPSSGIHVTTAFNAGTANVLDIGTSADPDAFATDLALGTADFVALDVASGSFLVTSDTTITATPALTGTAATAGSGEVVIEYIPDNDG